MGRESTFADAKIIELVNSNFILVAADDWYQRRREDDEGVFFRKVASKARAKGKAATRRSTSHRVGKLLGYRITTMPMSWRFHLRLFTVGTSSPRARRAKGRCKFDDVKKVDTNYAQPPKDGLIVNVHRILDCKDDLFSHGTCRFPGGDKTAHDRLWLTAAELQALMPKDVAKDQEVALPEAVQYRLARFHLMDNTRGEPPMWTKPQVRSLKLKLVAVAVKEADVRLKLTGTILLSTQADTKQAERGYDVALLGDIRYDPKTRKMTRFDVVALGDHWGAGPFTKGARPGRTPLGVALELADPEKAADRVPPQAARESNAYFRAER